MKIWKYELIIDDIQKIEMPVGARGLTAQWQQGKLCLWCMVDEDQPMEKRKVRIYGTGHGMEDFGEYIASNFSETYVGTFQMHDGALVFHVFLI